METIIMEKNTLIIIALEALKSRNNEQMKGAIDSDDYDYFEKQNEAIKTLIKETLQKKGTQVW